MSNTSSISSSSSIDENYSSLLFEQLEKLSQNAEMSKISEDEYRIRSNALKLLYPLTVALNNNEEQYINVFDNNGSLVYSISAAETSDFAVFVENGDNMIDFDELQIWESDNSNQAWKVVLQQPE